MEPNQKITNISDIKEFGKLQVFCHHIYEFQKGLRNLVLCTERSEYKEKITNRLQKEQIAYVIHEISPEKINVYFGAESCVEVVKTFNTERLDKISEEQDFILGIMLGYDRLKQCDRYLKRTSQKLTEKII